MKKILLSSVTVLALGATLAWAANNFRMATSGGTVTTFKSTDTAGVQTPHVNVDSLPAVTPGTGATNLGKAEDTVHATGDTGVFVLGVANEAQVVLAGDGDYIAHGADTKGNALVVGNVASGTTDSGNPVKVGAKYNSALPTFTDGQRGDFQIGSRGALNVQIMGTDSTAGVYVAASADGITTTNSLRTVTFSSVFNGTSWDRSRSVINATNSIGTGIAAVGILAQLDDTSPTAISENQFGNLRMTPNRALVMKPYSTTAGGDWTYAAAASGISNTTTAVTIKTAGAGSDRNCVTSIDLTSTALGAATEFAVRDGAGGTVLWRITISTAGLISGFNKAFPTPICGTAATLLEVVTLTASITGAVYVNAQGYAAP